MPWQCWADKYFLHKAQNDNNRKHKLKIKTIKFKLLSKHTGNVSR